MSRTFDLGIMTLARSSSIAFFFLLASNLSPLPVAAFSPSLSSGSGIVAPTLVSSRLLLYPSHQPRPLNNQSILASKINDEDNIQGEDDSIISPQLRKGTFLTALLAENVISYTGPGSDGTLFPQSDLDLISNLIDPQVINCPPSGSGIGIFSYLLFNSFIYLPVVWAALLLPEACPRTEVGLGSNEEESSGQVVPVWPFIAISTAFGGIGLYPYLALRKPKRTENIATGPNQPILLAVLEGWIGRSLLVAVNAWLLWLFIHPFLTGCSNLSEEWSGFLHLLGSSQFVCTSTLDAVVLGVLLLDPISDDAKRRGVLEQDASFEEALSRLWLYMFPVFGSLGWVLARPQVVEEE